MSSLWGSIFGWLNANSFSLLAAVYLAWAACLIGLACFVYVLSRRLVRLSRQVEAHSGALRNLSASEASRARTIEAVEELRTGAAVCDDGEATFPQISRRELQSLLDEVSAEGAVQTEPVSQDD